MVNGFDRLRRAAEERERYAGKVVPKPWGHERQVFCNEDMSLWELTINPGFGTSLHRHDNKTTMLIVVQGVVTVTLDGIVREAGPAGIVMIERGVPHRTRSEHGAIVLELESPPDKRDLVRIEDCYGREGKGYEA